jgi:single-strand DNA-binding protein
MNHVNLIGRMQSKPKIVKLPNGRKIARFVMSTTDTYFDSEGIEKTKSNWHRIFAWGKWVQILDTFCDDGIELAVEGKLISKFYRSNGTSMFYQEIEVNDLIIL